MVRFAGVDIASEKHFVAVVNASSGVLVKSKPFGEDAAGYDALFRLLGEPEGMLVAMEATTSLTQGDLLVALWLNEAMRLSRAISLFD